MHMCMSDMYMRALFSALERLPIPFEQAWHAHVHVRHVHACALLGTGASSDPV